MKEAQKGTVGRNSKDKNPWCKFQRAITDASLADIMAKRSQKPKFRKAQREQAIRAAKEAKKAKQASKDSDGCWLGLPQRQHQSKRL